jgi:hypothetical protein
MPFKYIFDQVRSKVGATSTELNEAQATLIKTYINKACKEIYDRKDLPVVLQELYLKVNTDERTLALPPFVGELRAVRSPCESEFLPNHWSIVDARPRYMQSEWKQSWHKTRILKEQPLCAELLTSAPLTFEINEAENDVIVTVNGESEHSNRVIESVTMNATSKSGTKNFDEVRSIQKNKVSLNNILVKDGDGNEIAMLYADHLESNYKIIDVSEYPNLHCCEDGTYILEVLYKPKLGSLLFDNDCFPLVGYDDIIVAKTIQLLLEDEEGKEDRAILAARKVSILIDEKIEDKTGTNQKVLKRTPNKLLGLHRRYHRF